MKQKKNKLLLLIGLFILSCSNSPPAWVSSRPNNKDYWHGIGHAMAYQSPDFKAMAKESAIREISSQIKINISSEMEIITRDFNGSVDNMVSSVMKSRVNLFLPELELVGNYSDKNESYFYYRLNKNNYYEAMKKLRVNAENTALAYIRNAEKKYGVNSFYLIQKAWQEIIPFNDEPIMVNYDNENILLYSLIKQKLEEFNQRVMITGTLAKEKIKTLVDRENSILIHVMDRKSKQSLVGFPIKLSLPTNQTTLVSNKNGKIEHSFKGMTLASSYDILFQLDQEEMFKELTKENQILPMKPNLNSTTMHVSPAKVSIKSFEKNLDRPSKRKILEPAIKNIFNNKLEFVNDDPDFYIIIQSNTAQKAERAGNNYPYFVYGNATIIFQDSRTEEEFFIFRISDAKGADFGSQRVAGIRSYEKMEAELLTELEKEFRN